MVNLASSESEGNEDVLRAIILRILRILRSIFALFSDEERTTVLCTM